MAINVDSDRQTLIIYIGIAFSTCLGMMSVYMTFIHMPLMARNYRFAFYLELDIIKTVQQCMVCVSVDSFISSGGSGVLFVIFINKKARNALWRILRPIYLCHCILTILNIACVLLMIDTMGILQTDIQYRLYSKMKLYASNSSYNENKYFIDKLHQTIKCCGVTGPEDWFNIKWISLADLNDLKDFKYLTQQGLVSLAPLSCCDRMRTFICPFKDVNALKHYYSQGCRSQLRNYIRYKLLTTEIVLALIVIIFEIIIIFIFNLVSSSIVSMKTELYGKDSGIASFTNWIPTRHLEIQSRGTPLLMPPTEMNRTFEIKRFKVIEEGMTAGTVVGTTPYIRSVRESYSSTMLQRFLKYYFPIVERAIYDEDPNYNVIIFRFFSKALIGLLIAHLFLTAFSTYIEGQTQISETIVDLVRYSTYVSFTFAFIKSTKFRVVAILLIPNLGMKTGRAFLMAELARITAVGPLASIATNIQAVMLSLHCSIGIALNISKDVQKISINPMRKLVLKLVESSDSLKKATLDVYSASRPITNDIDESAARAEQIREALKTGQSTREVNLKNRFTKMLHKLDRMEQRKFQQKTQKLRDQYAKLEQQLRLTMVRIDQYKDIFSNKSSKIVSDIRTKMFSGCASIEQVKSQVCQKTIGLACGRMEQLISEYLIFGFGIKSLCYEGIDSDSSCNVNRALEKAEKCANEKAAGNVKDGFGGMHQGTKDGLTAMQEVFDLEVNWKFERKKFDITGDTILHGTASLTFTLTDSVVVFIDLIILLFVILKILLMLVIYRSYKYCKKYLSDITYDNKYVTEYFELVDKQRMLMKRSTLLPLKSYERKIVLYKRAFYTIDEINKVITDIIKVTAVILSLIITFLISDVLYTALEVIRDVSLIELKIRTDELLNLTTAGDGFIKHLLDILLDEVRQLGGFNVTYSLSDCAPDIKPVSESTRRLFIITAIIIYILTISNGYFIRSRHFICSYFYPKRERQRIVYLYNKLLVNRKRYMRTKKNIIIFKVKENRLEAEYSFLLSLRRDYPLFFRWLKVFSKYKCLICDDTENENFFICPHDFSPFCQDCFKDINKYCLVCFLAQLNAEQENVNNYYESQWMSDSDTSDYSTSGKENSDIEKSRELVGWSDHPIDRLKDDVLEYQSLMKKLNK